MVEKNSKEPHPRRGVPDFDSDTLACFVVLAREKTLARSARILGLNESTLSRQMQRLERNLRARLFVRTSRGIVLTYAGERALPVAQHMLDSISHLARELHSLQETPSGLVRVGTMVSIGATVLPPVLARVQKKFPAARFIIQEGTSDGLERLVQRGELDMAILAGPVELQTLVAKRLWHEEYFLAVPSSHTLAARRKPIALIEVAHESFAYLRGRAVLPAIAHACHQRGLEPTIVMETDNLDSVRKMVESGVCVALLPNILRASVEQWRAKSIDVTAGNAQREVFLVHRGHDYLSSAARAFRDAMASEPTVRALLRPRLAHTQTVSPRKSFPR